MLRPQAFTRGAARARSSGGSRRAAATRTRVLSIRPGRTGAGPPCARRTRAGSGCRSRRAARRSCWACCAVAPVAPAAPEASAIRCESCGGPSDDGALCSACQQVFHAFLGKTPQATSTPAAETTAAEIALGELMDSPGDLAAAEVEALADAAAEAAKAAAAREAAASEEAGRCEGRSRCQGSRGSRRSRGEAGGGPRGSGGERSRGERGRREGDCREGTGCQGSCREGSRAATGGEGPDTGSGRQAARHNRAARGAQRSDDRRRCGRSRDRGDRSGRRRVLDEDQG